MIIKELGTSITEVSGVEFIRIEPDAGSDNGVHVMIKFYSDANPLSLGMREFNDFAEAVALANDRVQWLANHQGS